MLSALMVNVILSLLTLSVLSKIAADDILKLIFLSCQKIGYDMQIIS